MSLNSNIKFLKFYTGHAKPEFKQMVNNVIDLYSSRSVTNFKTAKNTLDQLTSNSKLAREKGVKQIGRAHV